MNTNIKPAFFNKGILSFAVFLVCVLNFAAFTPAASGQATSLVISSSPFSATQGNPSTSIVIIAWDDAFTQIDTLFNDTVSLSASSAGGRFSADRLNWQDTDAVTLVNGKKAVYYKDTQECGPDGVFITVSREGLVPASQSETVQVPWANGSASYISVNTQRLNADAVSSFIVIVTVNDTCGFPLAGEQVTIHAARGEPADTIIQPVSLTDAEGQCTGAILSENAGDDTITAECGGAVISRGFVTENAEGIWHFDSGLTDSSGKGYAGTNYGGLWVSDAVSGSAVRYDGAGSFMQCDSSTVLNTAISIEAWVKAFSYPSGNSAQMVGKYPGPWLFSLWPDGTTAVEVEAGVNFLLFAGAGSYPPLALNEWNHLVAVYVQNGDFRTYLNGAQVEISSPINPLGDDGSILFRASSSYPSTDANGGSFDGIVDEVKIYSRALSPAEVYGLYSRQCPVTFLSVKKAAVITPAFSVTGSNISLPVIIEARDRNQNRIAACNDPVTLFSFSPNGRFSVSSTSWADTTQIYFSEGSAVFYYMDPDPGNPVIQVSGEGFIADSQVETVLAPGPGIFTSFISAQRRIKAAGIDSGSVTVTLLDTFCYPVAGVTITLVSARGNSVTIQPTNQPTDVNGQCVFGVSSVWRGQDTFIALAENGEVISENLLLNPSFESGAEPWPDSWARTCADRSYKWDRHTSHSGNRSLKVEDAQTADSWTNWEQVIDVEPGFGYVFSGWIKTGALAPGACAAFFMHHLDAGGTIIAQNWTPLIASGGQGWAEYSIQTTAEQSCAEFRIGCSVYQSSDTGSTAWFDDARLARVPTAVFTAGFLKIVNPAFVMTRGNPAEIGLQAQDASGNVDTDYSETASLSSNSLTGRFSADKINWSVSNDSAVTLSAGSGVFYYEDPAVGDPVLSAMSNELSADSQSESIVEPSVLETNCFMICSAFRTSANGVSPCTITVVVNDTFGYPVANVLVSIASSRGNSVTIQPASQPTSIDGRAVFTLRSNYEGMDTVTAFVGGKPVTRGVRKDITGFWKFEESQGTRAGDASGKDNNGILKNSPAWAAGRLNRCLDYDGINDYVSVPSSEGLNPGTGSITVEAWVKTSQAPLPEEGDKIIVRKDTTGSPRTFWGLGMIGYDTGTLGRGQFQVYKIGSGSVAVLSNSVINDGEWHHMAGIRDASINKIKLYMDGVLQGSADEAYGSLGGSEPLSFGSDESWFGAASCFSGLIDEIKLYPFALTETEVIASYRGTCAVYFVPGATGIKITSDPFTVPVNDVSSAVTLEARDAENIKVGDFNETASLSSSSATGRFSPDGINWSSANNTFVYFNAGVAVFYYMDSSVGNPVLTADHWPLATDSQTVAIIPPPFPSDTASFILLNSYLVPGDGISACTAVVCVQSDSGILIAGETVALHALRGGSTTIQPANQQTDLNGCCTWTLSSAYPGQETITASCAGLTITRAVQRSGAAAIWRFDETGNTALDISGNASSGSISGAVHIKGKSGPGLHFNGVNDIVTVQDSPNLYITGEITIEAWVFLDAFADTADWHHELINKTEYNNMRFFVRQSNHRLCVTQNYTSGIGVDDGNSALSAGQWYHIAFTYDREDLRMFINGAQDIELARSGDLITSHSPVQIGKLPGSGGFKGVIDELRIYSRALAPEEILASYNSSAVICFTGVPAAIKFTSPGFSVPRDVPSQEISVEVQDQVGRKCTTFNDTVSLSSSSLTGRFSKDKVAWSASNDSAVTLSSGSATFYYKDSAVGNPMLSAMSNELSADSQTESIVEPSVLETNCFIVYSSFRTSANGASSCTVSVVINDTFGNPISGVGVTLVSSRGNSVTIQPANQPTDSNGCCTWTVKSIYDGMDILTVVLQNNAISRGIRKDISGFWKFEEGSGTSARDHSGKNNSGALKNSPVWSAGRFNECLQFNGSTSYVAVPNAGNLNPGTGSFTVEAWVKTSQSPAPLEGDKVIIRKDTTESPRMFWGLVMNGYDTATIGRVMFQVYKSTSGVAGVTSGGVINDNQWHHLIGIRDGAAGQISLYVDGVFQGSAAEAIGDITGNESLSFGNDASWFGPVSGFQGLIDEIKVYPSALTETEMLASYAGSCGITFVPAAVKLRITPSPFSIPTGSVSPAVAIEAQNVYSMKDDNFNDTAGLSSSSLTGRFSADGISWSASSDTWIQFTSGAGVFYYKDPSPGNPLLSAMSNELSADSITVSIYLSWPMETNSYFILFPLSARADGVSACTITVTVNDTFGYPVQGLPVTIVSARGSTSEPANQLTDSNGQSTWALSSGFAGTETVSVVYADKIINRGLDRTGTVGIWKLDEGSGKVCRDLSGNNNNAVFSASSPVWQAGKSGYCLQFAGGSSQYIIAADAASLDISQELSLCAWIYPTALGPSERTVMAKENTCKMDINAGGAVRFLISSADGWGNYVMGGNIPLNQWTFLAATFDGFNKKIFVNGVEAASKSGTPPLSTNNEPLVIGARCVPPDAYSTFFTGLIDEARVYSRALSASEIKMLMGAANANPYFTATNLVFATPPFKMKAGSVSPLISVCAGGTLGGTDLTYPNTTILISTTSNSGSFSKNSSIWVPVNSAQFSGGQADLYYRDFALGMPVLRAAHPDADLETGAQTEKIAASRFRFLSGQFEITTAGVSPQVKAVATGDSGETDVTFTETALLISTSSAGRFSLSNTNWQDTTEIVFSAGSVAYYYLDRMGGYPSIVVYQPDLEFSESQNETVVMPVITLSKIMRNLNTGIADTLLTVGPGHIAQYELTISNLGTETAVQVSLRDTFAFDTSVFSALEFVSMDTDTVADSWACALDSQNNWQAWGTVPAVNAANVKGLRWRINALAPGEVRVVKFRVKIK